MRYTSSVSAILSGIQRYGLGLVTAVDGRGRHSRETSAIQKFGPGSCWLVTGHQDDGGPGEMVAERAHRKAQGLNTDIRHLLAIGAKRGEGNPSGTRHHHYLLILFG